MERSAKPLAKKLALKPGQTLLLLNAPGRYRESLLPLPEGVALATQGKADAVQVFATTRKELEKTLPGLKRILNPGGMVWVTYPKQTSKVKSEINRDSIREYALTVGFDTVTLFAVDDDWSAIRLKPI